MAKNLVLKSYQKELINFTLKTPRCGLFLPMGTGKTTIALHVVSYLKLLGKIKGKTLVLSKKKIVEHSWPQELQKWPELKTLSISVVAGDEFARKKALKKEVDIYAINYENLQWLCDIYDNNWKFTVIIADEATALSNFRLKQGGKRSQRLAKHAFSKIERFILLTGTPTANSLTKIWGMMWFLDEGLRLGRSYAAFSRRWFYKSGRFGTEIAFSHAKDEIPRVISDICVSLDNKKYFTLKEPIINKIKVELPIEAKKIYRDIQNEALSELKIQSLDGLTETFNILSKNMAVRLGKCLQASNGTIYVDETGDFREIHTVKLEALAKIINDLGDKQVLVAYHYKSDLKRLRQHFPQGKTLGEGKGVLEAWNAGKLPILFINPASDGYGLSLQDGGHVIIFFTIYWDLESHDQAIERIGAMRQAQSGYERPVFIYYILAKNTIDELVYQRLLSKRGVQAKLLKKLEFSK